MARDGIKVTYDLAADLDEVGTAKKQPRQSQKFINADGSNYKVSEIFKQPDLAWTLSEIAKNGVDAFYRGSVAEKIVADMEAHNGLITMEDLSNYEVIEREPVRGTYRGYEIEAMPAPSSWPGHILFDVEYS